MENGKVGYLGFLRHNNPLLCAQRALAAHLCQRYNLDAVLLPDPRKPEDWNSWALWPASLSNVNVSYDQVRSGGADISPVSLLLWQAFLLTPDCPTSLMAPSVSIPPSWYDGNALLTCALAPC